MSPHFRDCALALGALALIGLAASSKRMNGRVSRPSIGLRMLAQSFAAPRGAGGARWAGVNDCRSLAVSAPCKGRLAMGRSGRHLLAAEPGQSIAVIGPTQTGKTSGFAVPAILEWEGPVLATSVKTDLTRDTMGWRSNLGEVAVFDPACVTGAKGASWSPLDSCATWPDARRTAASLTDLARDRGSGLADGEFWYSMAAKLLSPLLFAAAASGRCMGDVIRWLDDQEEAEVAEVLCSTGVEEALRAARASWSREERQRSSVYATAESVLEVFADPELAAMGGGSASRLRTSFKVTESSGVTSRVDPASLVSGGSGTI
ncbi:MAG: type IV secretory system conjugative DNA transfer family protein, partial [Actinobacteria bacterium]|nr:type IV secretory system conjugative DNA transfer family protein [Actinomycetota bacterium]